jgi:hypothetical protein
MEILKSGGVAVVISVFWTNAVRPVTHGLLASRQRLCFYLTIPIPGKV